MIATCLLEMDGSDWFRDFHYENSRSLILVTLNFTNAKIPMAMPLVGTFLLPFTKLKLHATLGQSNGWRVFEWDLTVHNLWSLNSRRIHNPLPSLADMMAGEISLILHSDSWPSIPSLWWFLWMRPRTLPWTYPLTLRTFDVPQCFQRPYSSWASHKFKPQRGSLHALFEVTSNHSQVLCTSILCTPATAVLRYFAQVHNPGTLLGLHTPCTAPVPTALWGNENNRYLS